MKKKVHCQGKKSKQSRQSKQGEYKTGRHFCRPVYLSTLFTFLPVKLCVAFTLYHFENALNNIRVRQRRDVAHVHPI